MNFDFSKPCEKPGTYKSAIQFIDKLWAYPAQLSDKFSQSKNEVNSNNSSMPPQVIHLKSKQNGKSKLRMTADELLSTGENQNKAPNLAIKALAELWLENAMLIN